MMQHRHACYLYIGDRFMPEGHTVLWTVTKTETLSLGVLRIWAEHPDGRPACYFDYAGDWHVYTEVVMMPGLTDREVRTVLDALNTLKEVKLQLARADLITDAQAREALTNQAKDIDRVWARIVYESVSREQ